MGLATLIILLANAILSRGRLEIGPIFDSRLYEHDGFHNNSMERAHYNPWACNYRVEPGYKCLSCHKALHCYINNFALLVQCGGIFPYCRNGYCSLRRDEGCVEDEPNKPGTVHAAGHVAVTEVYDVPVQSVTVEVTTELTDGLSTTVESTT